MEAENLELYCKSLVKVKLSSHRPQLRQARSASQFKGFSVNDLDGNLNVNYNLIRKFRIHRRSLEEDVGRQVRTQM